MLTCIWPAYRLLWSHPMMIGGELRKILHDYAIQDINSKPQNAFVTAIDCCTNGSALNHITDPELHAFFANRIITTTSSHQKTLVIPIRIFKKLQTSKKNLYLLGLLCASDISIMFRLPKFSLWRKITLLCFSLWDHAIRSQLHDIGFCDISMHCIERHNHRISKGNLIKKTRAAEASWKIYREFNPSSHSRLSPKCIAVYYVAEKTPLEF